MSCDGGVWGRVYASTMQHLELGKIQLSDLFQNNLKSLERASKMKTQLFL